MQPSSCADISLNIFYFQTRYSRCMSGSGVPWLLSLLRMVCMVSHLLVLICILLQLEHWVCLLLPSPPLLSSQPPDLRYPQWEELLVTIALVAPVPRSAPASSLRTTVPHHSSPRSPTTPAWRRNSSSDSQTQPDHHHLLPRDLHQDMITRVQISSRKNLSSDPVVDPWLILLRLLHPQL